MMILKVDKRLGWAGLGSVLLVECGVWWVGGWVAGWRPSRRQRRRRPPVRPPCHTPAAAPADLPVCLSVSQPPYRRYYSSLLKKYLS